MSLADIARRMFPVDQGDLQSAIAVLRAEMPMPLTSRQAIAIRGALMAYEAQLQDREVPSTICEYVIRIPGSRNVLYHAGTYDGPQWWAGGRANGLGPRYSFVTAEDARSALAGLLREYPYLTEHEPRIAGVIAPVEERLLDVEWGPDGTAVLRVERA